MKGKFIAAGLAAMLALSATAALAQEKKPDVKADADSQSFIKGAIQGNMAEVDVGKLAQQKGKNPAVKQFGAMLVKDHSKALQDAKAAAKAVGVTPPGGTTMMEKTTYAKLKILSGGAFDKSFANSMVSDHQSDIKEYEKAAAQADAVGQYAKQTLPHLKSHLDAAQKLQQQLAAATDATENKTTGAGDKTKKK